MEPPAANPPGWPVSGPTRPEGAPSEAGALLVLTLAVGGVSMSGPLVAATAAPALAVAFWRNALAVGALAPIALCRRRAELRATSRRVLLLSLAAGALLALHFGLWLPSLRLTSVASSTALVTTTPLWTVLLLRLGGSRPPRLVLLGTLTACCGVLVLTGVDVRLSGTALTGDALALAGGMAAAGYMLLGERVRQTASTTAYTLLCYTATTLLLLTACLTTGQALLGYPVASWWKLLALTACAQLGGHTLVNLVVRRLGASVVSTALLLETPGAALVAGVWLGQVPPIAAYPALLLIVTGLALVVRANRTNRAHSAGSAAVTPAGHSQPMRRKSQ